ncbi:MAG TPA: DMT family transporter [Vitreimonas sp.]|jgi:drug/metabolite transporter (DMT)-like permease|nr:DMT family transporter [Vitreimonas sp.]
MSGPAGHTKAALAALTGAAFIGLSPIAVRLSDVGPEATNFWRFVFAAPILVVWALLSRPKPNLRQTGWLLFAGVLFGIEVSLWAAALTHTTVTNATLLVNLTPIFAAGLGWLLLKERLNLPIGVGIAVALTGAVLLALSHEQFGGAVTRSTADGLFGDGLAFSGALGYAGYLLVVRALGKNVGVGGVMFWATLTAALVALAAALALHEQMLPHSVQGWLILIGLGLIVQVAGQGLIAYGVARLPIAMSTVLLWMQPLVAAVLSWIMFGEALTALAFVGAALILGGVYVVQRSRA